MPLVVCAALATPVIVLFAPRLLMVATGVHQRVFFCRAWAVWFRWAALRR